jgi:glycosyltransferase involved in cell wall biosynthesis
MISKRLAIVTDAWCPQVNGVVTTLQRTAAELGQMGFEVRAITPEYFSTLPLPSYPEIRVPVVPGRKLARLLDDFGPYHIHIATEGSLGIAARRYCLRNGLGFTTSYHTQFPEYVRERLPIPLPVSYAVLRRFHSRAQKTMVATRKMREGLTSRGFKNLVTWERGVDTELFRPIQNKARDRSAPVWIYVGRVAVEKNIEAFLKLEIPGTKQVVGDGPARAELQNRYPDVQFLGYRFGEELSRTIAAADVFVFPSLTDTYGLVMLEAMACGIPVAAFPVTGPVDVISPGVTGVLDNNLHHAAMQALQLDGNRCREEALKRTWRRASEQFASNLVPVK